MTEKPAGRMPPWRLRALAEWFKGAAGGEPEPGADATPQGWPARIGHYSITGKLGAGGMGIVYSARDERLGRAVALKTMKGAGPDERARQRFWREARAAASVSHPNVCQLYEIGEEANGELFISMELLEGEPLSERLRRGSASVPETMPIALGMLAALQALHARGIIHRDLKPSNVFLTPHGVKVLDFGLARPTDPDAAESFEAVALTRTGMVVGTPRYMAPEQVTGEELDARTDLFATGAILFEMLAGRPAFSGRNAVEILHATLHEQPPALTGSAAVVAIDRVLRRALAKNPVERPASAEAMAEDLRAVGGLASGDAPAVARALTRLVVLPFRILRPDPETDFLAFSLADAIATSLSGIGSLVVRSSAFAARLKETTDLKTLAADADVDRVVTGSLLRAGDQIRASAQLVEAPGGTLLTSHTVQVPLGDLFHLQDDIARRVVEALALPLTAGAPTTMPDAPQDARAYALYLQANELARSYTEAKKARDVYQQCLDLDPTFAPAWAQIGRCHWLVGRFVDGSEQNRERAEAALRRALELNPRLTLAHKVYANIESNTGNTIGAVWRLLAEASRHGNDPELFTGLVHACRYCGLFEQSLAAHAEARRLDPNIVTSVAQTLLLAGEYERLFRTIPPGGPSWTDDVILAYGYGLAGRHAEARRAWARQAPRSQQAAFKVWTGFQAAWLERRPQDMRAAIAAGASFGIADDPERMFNTGWLLCDVGEFALGLGFLQRAIARGFFVAPALRATQFDGLRTDPSFQQLLADAEQGRQRALAVFREAGGERLLGH